MTFSIQSVKTPPSTPTGTGLVSAWQDPSTAANNALQFDENLAPARVVQVTLPARFFRLSKSWTLFTMNHHAKIQPALTMNTPIQNLPNLARLVALVLLSTLHLQLSN